MVVKEGRVNASGEILKGKNVQGYVRLIQEIYRLDKKSLKASRYPEDTLKRKAELDHMVGDSDRLGSLIVGIDKVIGSLSPRDQELLNKRYHFSEPDVGISTYEEVGRKVSRRTPNGKIIKGKNISADRANRIIKLAHRRLRGFFKDQPIFE